VSVHTVANQTITVLAPLAFAPIGLDRAVAAPADPARRLRLVPPAAAPVRPMHVDLLVTRFTAGAEREGTCALCWTGPGLMAGSVHHCSGTTPTDIDRPICSRCLVSLEMLAVQFAPNLRLSIETPT
jgi:hypothetical protein